MWFHQNHYNNHKLGSTYSIPDIAWSLSFAPLHPQSLERGAAVTRTSACCVSVLVTTGGPHLPWVGIRRHSQGPLLVNVNPDKRFCQSCWHWDMKIFPWKVFPFSNLNPNILYLPSVPFSICSEPSCYRLH